VTGHYFSLGAEADAIADEHIRHYYGDGFFATARADTLTTTEHLRAELAALQAAGTTDVVLSRPRASSTGRPAGRSPQGGRNPLGSNLDE
jgi:hypothetical protein